MYIGQIMARIELYFSMHFNDNLSFYLFHSHANWEKIKEIKQLPQFTNGIKLAFTFIIIPFIVIAI